MRNIQVWPKVFLKMRNFDQKNLPKNIFPSTDYICSASNLNINSENTKISKVTGQHIKKSIKDVTKFSSVSQNLQFLPQNIQNFFPNLTKVEIISSNLQKLAPLENIQWMKIVGNDLKEVEDVALTSPAGIEFVDLAENKITKIPQNFFSELTSLEYLNLNGNFLTEIDADFVPKLNVIQKFYASNNKLEKIANDFIKTLKDAEVIELNGNVCVDNKFDRTADNSKKFNELYGEVVLYC